MQQHDDADRRTVRRALAIGIIEAHACSTLDFLARQLSTTVELTQLLNVAERRQFAALLADASDAVAVRSVSP